MIGHTFQVFFYEFRRNLRRRGYLFTTFGVPLIAIVLVLGYQFISSRASSSAPAAPNPAQDLAQQLNFTNVGRAGYVDLSGLFPDPGSLAPLLTRYPDEASAQAALQSGQIALYYVIAADYLKTGDVTLVQPRLNVSEIESAPIQRLIVNTLSKGVNPQVLERLLDTSHIQTTNLALVGANNGPQNEGASFIVIYVFGLALLIGLFTTNGYLMQSVIEEKETRMIEILISTVRPAQLLAGKILAMGLIGLFQIAVWIGGIVVLIKLLSGGTFGAVVGALVVIANIQIPLNILPLLLVYFVLAYFMFAGLYTIVGAISNSLREGPQYAVIFTLPAVTPLYFIAVFSTSPNNTLAVALSLIPITSPLAMAERLVITTVPTWQIAVSMALIALTGLAVMWAAGRIFRVQVLLAGQMPKLRDLPRLLRG